MHSLFIVMATTMGISVVCLGCRVAPPVCHPSGPFTVSVVNSNCGDAGVIAVGFAEGECTLRLSGTQAVGLPERGVWYDENTPANGAELLAGNWGFIGGVENNDAGVSSAPDRNCQVTPAETNSAAFACEDASQPSCSGELRAAP